MTLASFGALLWLLPLGGLIVALYLLKMRRKDLRVPASFLWPAMTSEVRANSLFQRLRFSWLLLLQLLALALIVIAYARPQTRQSGLTGTITVLVLDTSASMKATDAPGSRFGEAVSICRGAIDGARIGDRIGLIEAGPAPRVVFPLSGDSAKMRSALSKVRASDSECDVGAALRLAAAIVGAEASGRIVLISDGAFGEVRDFSPGKASLLFRRVGSRGANVAITALGTADTQSGRQVFCGIHNFGKEPVETKLTFTTDGRVFDSRKTRLGPGQTGGETASLPAGAKVVEAKLDGDDLLKADNYAAVLADTSGSLRVLLVTKGDLFLERALALDPRVTLDRAAEVPAGERAGSPGPGQYDAVIFDGIEETAVKSRNVLTFGAAGAPSPVTPTGTEKAPSFLAENRDHPLLRYVDLKASYVDRCEKVTAKPQGQVLAESRAGPLVVLAEGAKRQVYVAFKPLESDFPLQVGFPIFIANTLDYFGTRVAGQALAVRTGRPFQLAAPTDRPALLTSPAGDTATIPPLGGTYTIREALTAGKYSLEVDGKRSTIYASLLNETESNCAPVSDLRLGSGEVRPVKTAFRIGDFWRPVLLLAILVLGIEWWMFARRS